MLRSLNSGVTGLMNHQVRMDVIGNNIANVNTIGYRGRRTTFEESFNQLVKGASRTESKAGGTNPMQVGLGVAVGSIDIMTGQGQLQNTGRLFDLAIEGNAFFGVSDGSGTYYTRNGAFQLDNDGYIILPTNGMVLQGKMADLYGNFPPGTAIGNLQIPMTQQAPAKETTEIKMGKNLNSDSGAKGSISYTQQFLVAADGARYGTAIDVLPGGWPTGAGAPPIGDRHGTEDTGRTETPLSSLYDSNGNSLGMMSGDFLTISWYSTSDTTNKDPSNLHTLRIKVVGQESDLDPWDTFDVNNPQVRNLQQLIEAIEAAVNMDGTATPNAGADRYEVSLTPNGSISVNFPTAATPTLQNPNIFSLQIKSNNPIEQSASYVSSAFSFASYIGDGTGRSTGIANLETRSVALLRPAERYDYIENLKDSKGNSVNTGLEAGDTIDVYGSVGKNSIEGDNKSDPLAYWTQQSIIRAFLDENGMLNPDGSFPDPLPPPAFDADGNIVFDANGDPPAGFIWPNGVPKVATMLDELMKKIIQDFSLPADYVDKDGSLRPSVYMDYPGTDDGIPPGSMVIMGSPGEMFQINNLQIRAENSDLDENSPSIFNGISKISQKRAASNAAHIPVEIPVYDSAGTEHTLTIVFVQSELAGEWKWEARFSGREEINPKTSGTGRVFFGPDGAVSSWTFDNGGSELIVDPKNGADFMRIRLDVGGPGNFKGITQWDGATTVNTIGQDGYGTGVLTELTIDEFGLLEGSFSNGTHRPIAQLLLVDFANPGGLLDVSDSVYTTSANSGDPIWGTPKRQSSSSLKAGALEMSNVDLSSEFTTMITTQRGYQANSRIITVSDTMLEELVNLKR